MCFCDSLVASAVLVASLATVRGTPLEPIFNGSDLAGWKVPTPNPFWKVVQGVLVGENDPDEEGSVLFTQALFQNFLLETEVRWSGEIDSGIMLRKPELQLQLGVSRSLQRDMTCSFYTGSYPLSGQAQGVAALWREGDWNTIRLQALGNLFTVWLNGSLVTEFTSSNFAQPASIGLQIHADLPMKIEFRTVRGSVAAVADADEDGLPDAWERSHWATVRHGATGDVDGDSLSNLIEYALGLDPNVPGLTGLPTQGVQDIDGETYRTLTVTRNPAATDVTFQVELSNDLATWRNGNGELVTIENSAARLQVRDATPMNAAARRFFRLVVATQ